MSPAARIISTTMPDGPGVLPAFICEILNHINGDWDGIVLLYHLQYCHSLRCLGNPDENLWFASQVYLKKTYCFKLIIYSDFKIGLI